MQTKTSWEETAPTLLSHHALAVLQPTALCGTEEDDWKEEDAT